MTETPQEINQPGQLDGVRPPEAPPDKQQRISSAPVAGEGVPFGSCEVRLSLGQWIVTLAIVIGMLWALPALWKQIEPLETGRHFRVPFNLNNDYWYVQRWFDLAADSGAHLVVGDSVIWGRYTSPDGALPARLQARSQREFANLGINGIHPVAIHGLLRHYGGAIEEREVLMNYNPLWMHSADPDLSTDREVTINHPRLLPQLWPRVPAYKESLSERIGYAIKHRFECFSWVGHLRITYFNNSDIPNWTIENPYSLPTRSVDTDLPNNENPDESAQPWNARGIRQQNFQWLALEDSLQWRFFRESIEMLRARDNRVFVIIGPFNEHMLSEESAALYAERKREMAAWLEANGVDYLMPDPLPSELYVDASHPNRAGYALLAEQLMEHAGFREIFMSAGE